MPTHRPRPYDDQERDTLHVAFLDGEPLTCPRCGVELDRRPIPPRPDVSYVRDRLWVSCPRCGGSTVLDHRQPR